LGRNDFKTAEVILPNPKEQNAIAHYLDRKTAEIDELITDKKLLLELYEEEKTAIINQAVTKGINPDVPMKDSGIEWLREIPEHWEVKRLKQLTSII
jgi:type I restriction enzyme S subunit